MTASFFNTAADKLDTARWAWDLQPFTDLFIPGMGTVGDEAIAGGLKALTETCRWTDDILNKRVWNIAMRPFTGIAETAMVALPYFEYFNEAVRLSTGVNITSLPSDMILTKTDDTLSKPSAPTPA